MPFRLTAALAGGGLSFGASTGTTSLLELQTVAGADPLVGSAVAGLAVGTAAALAAGALEDRYREKKRHKAVPWTIAVEQMNRVVGGAS